MSTRFSSRNKKGFTLIELLIVITIIGILAVALIPRISQGPAKARDVKRESDIGNISTALELYYSDNGSYPLIGVTTPTAGAAIFSCLTPGTGAGTIGSALASYLQAIPQDPTSSTVVGPCTGNYGYYMIGIGSVSSYALFSKLETSNASSVDNLYCVVSFPTPGNLKTYSDAASYLASIAKTAGSSCPITTPVSGTYYIILR